MQKRLPCLSPSANYEYFSVPFSVFSVSLWWFRRELGLAPQAMNLSILRSFPCASEKWLQEESGAELYTRPRHEERTPR